MAQTLFQRAQKVLPGGVNSPVRAFRAVGGEPRFIHRAQGAHLWDMKGNELIDLIGSWGPMILGHGHPRVVEAVQKQCARGFSFGAPTEIEVEMAELIRQIVPSMQMVRMVSSGTEACMSAIRLARAATGREFVMKFEGSYHGHGDSFLSKAGSGAATLGIPTSPGVPGGLASKTLNANYNDLASVETLFTIFDGQIAAVIVEPVAGNMGVVPPRAGFLEGLRSLCSQHGAMLIFDEVMTGFRVGPGGAQQLYNVTPDLTTLGKIIGGGLPVGAYGGRRDLMEMIAPAGPVYQAGTLSGNPLGMTAGLETLRVIQETPSLYSNLETMASRLETKVAGAAKSCGFNVCIQRVGSMGTFFFGKGPIHGWEEARQCDTVAFGKFFHDLLSDGVHLPPAQFEAWFLSAAHTNDDIDRIAEAAERAFDRLAPE